MIANILITGGAGYLGGSVIADFLSRTNSPLSEARYFTAVRSQEQAEALSKLDLKVLQLDLTNAKDVEQAILDHEISIVIHCASSMDPTSALHLIKSLGKQQSRSKMKPYFIHTSAAGAFSDYTGWPADGMTDADAMFEREKELADSFPVRQTDVEVIEHCEKLGITSFLVIPPMVYGKGGGEWNQLSVLLPVVVKSGIDSGVIHRFDKDVEIPAVHISDMTALYGLILQKLLLRDPILSGKQGYYYAQVHNVGWWELLDRIAEKLHARGLVQNPEVKTWASDSDAAKAFNVPEPFVKALWCSNVNLVAENKTGLGWNPRWAKEALLTNIDDEIDAVLELGKAKSSLMSSFNDALLK